MEKRKDGFLIDRNENQKDYIFGIRPIMEAFNADQDIDKILVNKELKGDLLKELPALSKGQAIIAGAAVNTPVLCRVRQRITEHGAEDVDAPGRWLEWFEEDQASQRKRDQSLPAEPGMRGRSKLFKT